MCVSVCKNTLFEVYEIHPINMTRECDADQCRDVGSSPVHPGDRAGCFLTLHLHVLSSGCNRGSPCGLNMSPQTCLHDPNLNLLYKYL